MKKQQNGNKLISKEWKKYWKAVDDYLRKTDLADVTS